MQAVECEVSDATPESKTTNAGIRPGKFYQDHFAPPPGPISAEWLRQRAVYLDGAVTALQTGQCPNITTAPKEPDGLRDRYVPVRQCRYACSAFPNCGCEIEALNPPAGTCRCGEPVMVGFLVCNECWQELNKHEMPAMPWEV